MDKPYGSKNNGSSRYEADETEIQVGDTVGGNPNKKVYPKK